MKQQRLRTIKRIPLFRKMRWVQTSQLFVKKDIVDGSLKFDGRK